MVRRRLSHVIVVAVTIVGLGACESAGQRPDYFQDALNRATLPGPYGVRPVATSPAASSIDALKQSAPGADGVQPATLSRQIEPFEVRGTGQFVHGTVLAPERPALTPVADAGPDSYTLNFVDADLRQVVRAVLDETLKTNYTIDPRVQGTITLQTSRPLARAEVLRALEEALRLNGTAIVDAGGLLRIVPADQAGVSAPAFYPGPGQGRGVGVRAIPLKFISAGDLEGVLQPYLTGGAVRIDRGRNLLFVTGTSTEAANVASLVAALDVNWLAGMSFALHPLREVAPDVVVAEIQQILDDPTGPKFSDQVRFVTLERLNAVLIVSKQPGYLDEARRWIARLDKGGTTEQRVHVYYVQNRQAAKLAGILGQIFSPDTVAVEAKAASVAPGLIPVTLAVGPEALPGGLPLGAASEKLAVETVATPAEAAPISVSGLGPIRVIADEDSNSLVTLASAADYRLVEAALRQLDTLPRQVLIEATLVEISLNEDLQYGLRWFFESEKFDSTFTFTDVATGAGSAVLGSTFPGFSYAFDSKNIRITLSALQGITDVKFLSSPTLMVLDNQTARLQVGDEVPVVTRTAQSTIDPDAPIVNTIEFRDTGAILDITPRVNAGGLVTLDIQQEVSEVTATTTSGIDSPTIQQRKLKSMIAVQSGEIIALGGLIRDRTENSVTGIPVLSDIPLLGNLFKSTDKGNTRTELLVLIKPQVIQNQDEARLVTEELRRKLPTIFPESYVPAPNRTDRAAPAPR